MPDSVGGAGFPNNVNVGHEHLDLTSGLTYEYQGGTPSNILNWKIIGGVSAVTPDTTGWGTKQLGASWFSNTLRQFRGWDGSQIVTMMSLEMQPLLYQTEMFVEDDFISGSVTNLNIGDLNWGLFALGAGGTASIIQPSSSPLHAGRVGIISLNATAGGAGNGVDVTMSQIGNYTWTPNLTFDMTAYVCPIDIDTDTLVRIGVGFETNLEPPTLGLYFEKQFADTTWKCVAKGAGTTTTDSTVAFASQWTRLRITRTSSSNIRFMINNTTVNIATANVPGSAQAFQSFALIKTNSASAKACALDYYGLRISGLNR